MAGPKSQYLEVPKVLPHRKARSRSRPREPVPTGDTASMSPRTRPHSPPVTAVQPPSSSPYVVVKPPSPSPKPRLASPVRIGSPPPRIGSPMPAAVQPPDLDADEVAEDLNGGLYTAERSLTPPTPGPFATTPLRERLVGAWKLESYTAYPTAESTVQRPTYPMTRNVTGLILYTPDGYMSAQMLIPGQQSFKRGEGAEPQWAEAAKRSFTYCGPYYITDEGPGREEILRHTFQFCNLPGWIGDVQIRTCRFEEDGEVLVLGSEKPSEIKGDKRIPVLKWRRARDNRGGIPPPPTPQIKVSGPGEP